ncbi:hypothetical protein Tco_1215046 [Tanacetum coccineum]
MGRTSYVGLEKKLAPIMQDLERRYPEIAKLECRRSKLHIFGRLSDNDFTNLKELTSSLYDKLKALLAKELEMKADGTYYVAGKDPLIECFGPEHSGRTRCVSNVVGKKKALGIFKRAGKKTKTIKVEDFDGLSFMGLLQGTSISSGSIDGFNGIEFPITMAKAMLYPRLDGMLNGIQMCPGYSKVQVDTVEDAYTNNFVEVPTDDVSRLSESFGHFIQCPQKYIKLCSRLAPVEPSMPTKPRLDENALQRMHENSKDNLQISLEDIKLATQNFSHIKDKIKGGDLHTPISDWDTPKSGAALKYANGEIFKDVETQIALSMAADEVLKTCEVVLQLKRALEFHIIDQLHVPCFQTWEPKLLQSNNLDVLDICFKRAKIIIQHVPT